MSHSEWALAIMTSLWWSSQSSQFVALLIAAVAAHVYLRRRARRQSLPPGPNGVPFLGNIFQITPTIWLEFTKWQKEYGDIFYVNLLGRDVVVLNTHRTATDLLDRRSRIYSDRMRNIVASEILTGGLLMVLGRWDDQWKRMKKAAHDGMTRTKARQLHPTQITEALFLLSDLLETPDAWGAHVRKSTSLLIFNLVYGHSTQNSVALSAVPRINQFATRLLRALYPGAHLVEFFPWMIYFPSWMAKWKRDAERWFKEDSAMYEELYSGVEAQVAEGGVPSSFASLIIEQQHVHRLSHLQASWLAGTMYAAGAETTSAVLAWFILAMVIYPDVQRRAQEEIDVVVGRTRVPTFEDYNRMPYIRAVVKEALRWQPAAPLGTPHRLIEDDWYEGYLIPKGAMVIPNVWSMNRDPNVYGPDAHEFNPSRHLTSDGRFAKAPDHTKQEGHASYGFGHRLCVGRHVANDAIFINAASILWAFVLEGVPGPDGCPVIPSPEAVVTSGSVMRPASFKCLFNPRFEDVPDVLEAAQELHGIRRGDRP
ncbi:uncharacterized protein FIBRA_00632 [Fibroporia radiculosa]|uniref:Cytochrome P450 n=1 Tax=Fibroporia radiculosa TaxID=599839 RepID=J4GI80_9APHY|nr:uncharacterized protein FIBRA_00632 [Fibroporia radiculosa]CCL98630.1 predicted protein [Fibroporia radiculosa]